MRSRYWSGRRDSNPRSSVSQTDGDDQTPLRPDGMTPVFKPEMMLCQSLPSYRIPDKYPRMTKSRSIDEPEVEATTLASAARELGLNPVKVRERVRKGWSVREALELDPRLSGRIIPVDEPEIKSPNLIGAARALGLNPSTVASRYCQSGWSIRQSLELDPPPKSHGSYPNDYFVYGILENDERVIYIGQSTGSPDRRWRQHREGEVTPVQKYMRGRDADFSFKVFAHGLDGLAALEMERDLIRQHQTSPPNGFNMVLPKYNVRAGHIVDEPEINATSISTAARLLGKKPKSVLARITQTGLTVREALGLDPEPMHRNFWQCIEEPEVSARSLKEACKKLSLDYRKIKARINTMGWSLREALELDPRAKHQRKKSQLP